MPSGLREWVFTVTRWLVTVGLLVGLLVGVRQLFHTAKLRGAQERTEDAARSGPRVRGSSTTVAATSTSLVGPSTSVPPTTGSVPAGEPAPLPVARVEASAVESPQPDSCNRMVNYDATNVLDGNLNTAWRAPGEGKGDTLQLTLDAPAHITQVGLVPGYAKVDLCSGFDRFPQLRRITSVTWRFDGGVTVNQTFKDRPELQSLPVDVTSATVVVEITGTTSEPQLDATAISEVRLVGVSG